MSKTHFLNVKELLETKGVSKTEIARLLFPDVKFPLRAFSRILTKEAELSASQVSILAERLGCEISDMYEPSRWIWESSSDDEYTFIYGKNFRVKVNLSNWESTIFYKNDLIDKGIFCDGSMPLKDYFEMIQQKIHDWIDLS